MAKTLMGAIARNARVEATFQFDLFGATKVGRKEKDWPQAVLDASAALVKAADDAAGAHGTVVQVQVYTVLTDPDGHPGFSAPGELIDVKFAPGATPTEVRVGDDEVVPTAIATARDAFKAAVEAAL